MFIDPKRDYDQNAEGGSRWPIGYLKPNPAYPDSHAQDARFVTVDVVPRYRLARPVTLAEIKQSMAFQDWELVRVSRLSVMPVTDVYWAMIHEMANQPVH